MMFSHVKYHQTMCREQKCNSTYMFYIIILLCNYKHGNLVRSISLKLFKTFYGTLYKYKASSDDMQRTRTVILPKLL